MGFYEIFVRFRIFGDREVDRVFLLGGGRLGAFLRVCFGSWLRRVGNYAS